MPLNAEQKAKKAAYMKQWRIDNREKLAADKKQWDIDNAERVAAYRKQYLIDNAERDKETRKQHYENGGYERAMKWKNDNPERYKEYMKQWRINNPTVLKNERMRCWASRGIIGDLSFIYDCAYITATHCWVCKTAFKDTHDRCCDHNHDSGEFRNVLCRACNNCDNWKKITIPKTT